MRRGSDGMTYGNFLTRFFPVIAVLELESLTQSPVKASGLVDGPQSRILQLLKNNPKLSILQLSRELGISNTAIDKNLKRLKDKGLLRRIGPDKGGHWQVGQPPE